MRSIRNAIQNSYAASRSMAVRLVLYWFIMALLLVAAILSILMATGVLSHPARQLASALDIQQKNTYAALDAQMDELTAHSVAISEKLGRELDTFLAAKGIPFDALNDDPATIAELEKPGTYEKMDALGKKLTDGLMELGKRHGIKVYANHHNAICQMQLGIDRAPEDFRDCLKNVDKDSYDKLYLLATQYGVRLTSARGRIYISTAHTEEDISKTLKIFDYIFPMLKK